MIKRRRVPRREFNRRVGLLVRGRYHVSRAVQISEGGMMTYSLEPLVVGQKVVLSFKLPGTPAEIVMATVRYVMPAQAGLGERYGMEFSVLDFNVKRVIRNYVAMQISQVDDDRSWST